MDDYFHPKLSNALIQICQLVLGDISEITVSDRLSRGAMNRAICEAIAEPFNSYREIIEKVLKALWQPAIFVLSTKELAKILGILGDSDFEAPNVIYNSGLLDDLPGGRSYRVVINCSYYEAMMTRFDRFNNASRIKMPASDRLWSPYSTSKKMGAFGFHHDFDGSDYTFLFDSEDDAVLAKLKYT